MKKSDKPDITRREFLGRTAAVAAGVTLTAKGTPAGETKRTAVDLVPLGKTGRKICRLGMGTGSMGGKVQRDLGQKEFTRLIHYGFEKGIRYIDTADAYRIHEMVREAIKDLPREELFIQTKMRWNNPEMPAKPLDVLDRFRRELGVDYLDSVLIHCVTTPTWDKDLAPMMEALSEAKEKKIIRLKGMSAHGLPGLTRAQDVDWIDVNLVRINPQGRHCDGKDGKWGEPGNVPRVLECIEKMHKAGRGVIGMKIIGNGDFTEPGAREKSIRFVLGNRNVDAIVIGFKSQAEIDEAIKRMNGALA